MVVRWLVFPAHYFDECFCGCFCDIVWLSLAISAFAGAVDGFWQHTYAK